MYLKVETNIAAGRCIAKNLACTKDMRKSPVRREKKLKSFHQVWHHATLGNFLRHCKSANIRTPTQCVINPINPSSIYTSILGSTHAYLFPKAQCREKCEKVEKEALKIECTGTVNTANSERDWSSPQNGWASCSSETMLTPAVTMTLSP